MLVFPAVFNIMVSLPLRRKGKLICSINFFHSVFSERSGEMAYEDFTPFTKGTVDDLSCSVADVYKVLSSLDLNKAIGPDAISPRILKECAAELAPSISQLFNFSKNLRKNAFLLTNGLTT